LLVGLREPDSRIRVVVTLRADFFDRPLEVPGLAELLRSRSEVILPMSQTEMEAAIARPAALAGISLEPRLLAAVIAETTGQPGSLPLTQYALTELFDRRAGDQMTHDAYQAIGGITSALGRRADEIFESLEPADQEATRQLFLRLVTLGEGVEDARRRVLLAELATLMIPEAGMQGVIDLLGRYRLLTFDHDPATRGPTIEVAHEALLREWPRLRGWLDESRADIRLQRLLGAEAAEWTAAGQAGGFLLRGSRLDQFEGWLETSNVRLTGAEAAFLAASQEARRQRQAQEEARRRRELETAQQLAETERRRAEEQTHSAARLRRRALLLAGALGVAALLAVAAVGFARSSGQNAAVAATRAAESNANAALAVENANVAATRQAEAVIEANQRATAEAEANVQRDTALASEREARESYSLSLAANARQALEANDQQLALLLALAANTVENPPLESWRTLLDVAYAPGAIREYRVGSPAFTLDVSPDGETMVTGSDDGRLRIWDVGSGEVLQTLTGHGSSVFSIAYSPDGTKMLSGDGDGTLFLWDVATGEIERELVAHKNDIVGMAFLPDGRRAISGEDAWELPGELVVWDLETGESIHRFGLLNEQVEGVRAVAVSPDGRTALVGYGSDSALATHPAALWDMETGELVRFLGGTDQSINGVAITPDGALGLGASADSNIYVWDMATGEVKQTLRGHETGLIGIAVSPNGITVLSGSMDGVLIHWELSNGQLIERYHDHQQFIWRVDFLNDSTAVTASNDGTARLWDLTGRWRQAQWRDPDMPADHQVSALQISHDGRFALTQTWQLGTGLSPRLTLWDYESGQPIRQLDRVDSIARDVAFMPDDRRALTGHDDGTLILWDLQTGQPVRRLEGQREVITAVDVSRDGRHAVSVGGFPEVLYWDLVSGEVIHRMIGHLNAQPANDVRFLPGDRQAVSAGSDGTMVIWDLATGEQIRRLTGLEGNAGSHRPAPGVFAAVIKIVPGSDGRRLLSAGSDNTLLLWEPETGRSMQRFVGHANAVISAGLFPDGRWAVTGAPRDPMFLWDVATGKPIRRFPFLSYPGSNFTPLIAVHPDGRTVLTDDVDGSIVKWLLAEPQPAELADWLQTNRALRELTCLERETYRIEPLCIDGEAAETTADLFAAVRRSTATIGNAPATSEAMTEGDGLPDMMPPERVPMFAVLGENRGELARGDLDIWTYEGRAGEVITVHMVADRPLTDRTIPLDARYEAGVLDTDLAIIGPDGRLMDFVNDETTVDLQRYSDARIIAVRLPEDGSYRIEARSALDDQAGAYTLIINQVPTVWYPDIYKEYVGRYLDGPWQWEALIYIEEGRLYYNYAHPGSSRVEMVPLSETEFATGNTSITRMVRDETGAVSGYEVLYGYEHQRGGQWYAGERVGDLPPEFLENLEAGHP
jgi:WD40 repeat protein